MKRPIIAFVAFPDLQNLDLTGPWEVFSGADRLVRAQGGLGYELRMVTWSGEPFRTSSGLLLTPDGRCDQLKAVDTLLICGGEGVREAVLNRSLVTWIADRASQTRRVGAVCTGAFLLAEAGLLRGREAVTHWSQCDDLADRYPEIDVQADPIFVYDGVYTSAGVTAGMDLALAMVESDHNSAISLEVARWLVLFLRRPGGQSQFSVQLANQAASRTPIATLQAWITDHLEADLSVRQLAQRTAMSPRNFARVFRQQVGVTPAAYVKQSRLQGARQQLEQTTDSLDEIAAHCGLGNPENLRRSFQRAFGIPPGQYRKRFR